MFDCNKFKRAVKDWMKDHPEGSEAELVDFCEDQIPPQYYNSHLWLIEQTVAWFKHIHNQRERSVMYHPDDESAAS